MSHPPDARVQASTEVTFRVVPGAGHGVLGWYVEEHWLPVLGPTCYLLARRVVIEGDTGLDVELTYRQFADALGVSPAKVRDAISRLRRFAPIEYEGDTIIVPDGWPDAPAPKVWA